MKKLHLSLIFFCFSSLLFAQTLYVPNGTGGIQSSLNGNVGIGINTPTKKLEVRNGDIRILRTTGTPQLQLTDSGVRNWYLRVNDGVNRFAIADDSNEFFTIDATNSRVGIGVTTLSNKLHLGGLNNDGINLDNKFRLRTSNTSDHFVLEHLPDNGNLYIRSMEGGDASGFLILNDIGGNVGIGKTNPSEALDVAGNIRSNYLILNALNTIEGGELRLNGASGFNDWKLDNYKGKFRLHHSGATFLTVHESGQLGIGTGTGTIGNHKLAVEGSIGAREIKVEANGWSDFVFTKDYDLPTLEEVETHISKNGHLPEIPSESEVLENGINLGEMDAKLLQKIEELTLYMIDMNKQVKSQTKRIEQLEKENAALKEKVNSMEDK